MKKFFLPLMIALMILTGCGVNQSENNVDGERGVNKFVIGIDDEYAPIAFHDERGELVGFDIDLAKEAARRMGVVFEFKPIDWNKKREEITSGNVDILWNGVDITDERKEYMIFSKPYMVNRQILLVKTDNDRGIFTEGDLEGKIVGTQAGSSSETYINSADDLRKSFREFKTFLNFKEAFAALDGGEVDVLICDELAARYEMSKRPPKFEIVEVTIGAACEIGIGFRKDDTELRDRVQKVFDEMLRDGTAKKISEHWFNADLLKYKR